MLDEPSAGLHPADTGRCARARQPAAAGNSLFVVEHELELMRRADWIVDVGPAAGEQGGGILYSGPAAGFADVVGSHTADICSGGARPRRASAREPDGWLTLAGVHRNNLRDLTSRFRSAC